MAEKWVKRWGYEIAATATRPSIWRLKTGGYLVRGRITDPRNGNRHQVMKVLHGSSLKDAVQAFDAAMDEERGRLQGTTRTRVRWSEFAASLLEEKILKNKLKSAASRERWRTTLEHYLIPEFGSFYVTELRRSDIEAWTNKIARWMKHGKPHAKTKKIIKIAPSTANGWLRILRTICEAARRKFDLHRSAFEGVEYFEEGRVYTAENPNAVPPATIAAFMGKVRELFPQHYAMILLGFVTGLRPSHMRPLRRSGPNADVLWKESALLIRRSNSRTGAIMDSTKTGVDQRLHLPAEMMAVLEWHVSQLKGEQATSEYLFPSVDGGMRTRTVLQKPFAEVQKALGLGRVTPRAMRRTFNDVARAAQVPDVVTRSISGHQTERMQLHYSTAQADEQRSALSRVFDMTSSETKGVKRGVTE